MGMFKDLLAWQKSLTLAKKVYQVTGNFPTEERFGLVNQMRRCAVSISFEHCGRLWSRFRQRIITVLICSIGIF